MSSSPVVASPSTPAELVALGLTQELLLSGVRCILPRVDFRPGTRLAPLHGGMSNLMYTVVGGAGERFVLRLQSPHLDDVIDRSTELKIVNYLGASGIGPHCYGACALERPGDAGSGRRPLIMRVEEFVEGRTLSVVDLRCPATAAAMACKVAALHAQRPDLRRRRLRRGEGGAAESAATVLAVGGSSDAAAVSPASDATMRRTSSSGELEGSSSSASLEALLTRIVVADRPAPTASAGGELPTAAAAHPPPAAAPAAVGGGGSPPQRATIVRQLRKYVELTKARVLELGAVGAGGGGDGAAAAAAAASGAAAAPLASHPPLRLDEWSLRARAALDAFGYGGGSDSAPPSGDAEAPLLRLLSDAINFLDEEIDWMSALLERHGGPIVLTHGDLQGGNWIEGPEALFLIDYEYSGWNARGLDLGNLFCEHTFDFSLPRAPGYMFRADKYPNLEWQRDFLLKYQESAVAIAALAADSEGRDGAARFNELATATSTVVSGGSSPSDVAVAPPSGSSSSSSSASSSPSLAERVTSVAPDVLAASFGDVAHGVSGLALEARVGLLASCFSWSLWGASLAAARALSAQRGDGGGAATNIFSYAHYAVARVLEYLRLKAELLADRGSAWV